MARTRHRLSRVSRFLIDAPPTQMRNCGAERDGALKVNMPDSDKTPILTALLRLAEVQLAEAWATVRDQNSYALALAGLGVAIVGIVVAGQNELGTDWWVPIPGLGLAISIALIGTRRGTSDLGPSPSSFYEEFGADTPEAALEQLLADLIKAQHQLPATLRAQRKGILVVLSIFAVTAVYSFVLLLA